MVRKLKLHEKKLLKKTDFMQWEVDQQGKQTEQMRKYNIVKREHYSLYNKLAAEVRSIAAKLKELPPNEPFRVRCVREMLSKLYAVGVIPTADTAERLGKDDQWPFDQGEDKDEVEDEQGTYQQQGSSRFGDVEMTKGEMTVADMESILALTVRGYVCWNTSHLKVPVRTRWSFLVSAACFARRRLPVVMKKIGMVDSIRSASDFVEQGHVRIGPKLVTDPAFVVTRNQEDAITWTNASKIKQHVLDYNNTRDDYDLET